MGRGATATGSVIASGTGAGATVVATGSVSSTAAGVGSGAASTVGISECTACSPSPFLSVGAGSGARRGAVSSAVNSAGFTFGAAKSIVVADASFRSSEKASFLADFDGLEVHAAAPRASIVVANTVVVRIG